MRRVCWLLHVPRRSHGPPRRYPALSEGRRRHRRTVICGEPLLLPVVIPRCLKTAIRQKSVSSFLSVMFCFWRKCEDNWLVECEGASVAHDAHRARQQDQHHHGVQQVLLPARRSLSSLWQGNGSRRIQVGFKVQCVKYSLICDFDNGTSETCCL